MKPMHFPIRQQFNLGLMTLISLLNIIALFIVPLILLPHSLYWSVLLIPIVLLTNTYWSLIHEAIHNIFHPNRKVNDYAGRSMTILFGTSFYVAQYGHLMHHAFNRTEQDVDRTDVFEANKHHIVAFTIKYYFELLGGLFLAEIFVPLLTWLPLAQLKKLVNKLFAKQPQMLQIMHKRLLVPHTLWMIRIDGVLMYLIYGLSFYCYGQQAWMLLVFLLVRGFMISFSNNLPHYGTQVNEVRYALNLSMPLNVGKIILNFNLHRTHHEYPHVPWHALPDVFHSHDGHCDINYFKQGLNQFKGPIPIERLI